MALSIFIFLPTNEDKIVDIIADKAQFNNFVELLINAIELINENRNARIYYHKDNIDAFFENCHNWEQGEYLEDVHWQITTFLGQALEIDDNQDILRENNHQYFLWNLKHFYDDYQGVRYAPPLIAEAAERLFQYPAEAILLLNFYRAVPSDRSTILVFKDELNLENPNLSDPPLPNSFAHIPFALNIEELNDWLNHFQPQANRLKVSANQIQQLINTNQTESIFRRIDMPKILGEQIHIHFKDENESALNVDGTWKHGGFNIPNDAKEELLNWGFILPN